jgi:hypothetical protein
MKTKVDHSITFVIILFVIILFSAIQIAAQETEKPNIESSANIKLPDSPQTVGDVIEFKNQSGTPILTITEQANEAGSILLPSVGSTLSGNKLYNNNGSLYWGNSALGTSSGNDNDWEVNAPITRLFNSTHSVGIGTPAGFAEAKLHVLGNDGVLFQGSFGNGTIVNLGAGARFHFYPKKGALRSGRVDGNQWDDANIGTNSTAFGRNTTANGDASISAGFESDADGNSSIAFGFRNTSTGNRSMAIGSETNARTFASFAIGRFNAGTGSATSWVETDPLFEIGNGASSSSLSNAMIVLKNGKIGINRNIPSSRLHLNGDTGEDPLKVDVNNVSKFGVYSNGGVTIGTNATPPTNGLYVVGGVQTNLLTSQSTNLTLNNNLTVSSTNANINSNVSVDENLSVDGTTKMGTNGIQIGEIKKITGTTDANNNDTNIQFPTGYNFSNTFILAIKVKTGEVNNFSAYSYARDGLEIRTNITQTSDPTSLVLTVPSSDDRNMPYEIILMRVE